MKRQRTGWLLGIGLNLLLGLGLGLTTPGTALANMLYVTDHILLGLHQGPAIDSPIIKSLPSGDAVKVLTQRDGFTQIRSIDGTVGWVNSTYLMADKPAHVLLQDLTDQQEKNRRIITSLSDQLQLRIRDLNTAKRRLASAKRRLTHLPATDMKVLAKAQTELKHLRTRVIALKHQAAKVAANPVLLPANAASLQGLRDKNLALNARIRLAVANLNGEKVPSVEQLASLDPGLPAWYLGLLAAVLLFGFVGGMLWLDLRYRRRHGGFRI